MVVVGAGFGGLATVKGLRRAGVDVTLVDRHNYHLFQPLLYQVASALLDPSDIAHPVRSILRSVPNCDFRLATVTGVDFERRIVRTTTGDLGYDHLVLATGSATSYFGNQALAGRAYGLKDLGEALALRARVLDVFEQASRTRSAEERRALLTFVIVGAGPTGVEYAGALSELVHHVLKRDFPDVDVEGVDIVLVEAVGTVLGAFAAGLGRRAEAALRRKGVRILFAHMVSEVSEGEVVFASGDRLAARTMIWTAGVSAEAPKGMSGLERAAQDRIRVKPATLEVVGHPAVYAIGDVAACPDSGRTATAHGGAGCHPAGSAGGACHRGARQGRGRPAPLHISGPGQHGHGGAQRRGRPDRSAAPLRADRLDGLALCPPGVAGELPQPAAGAHRLGVELRFLRPAGAADRLADPAPGDRRRPADPAIVGAMDDLYGAQTPDPAGGQQPADLYGGEQQVSWLDVPAHAPVVASDGAEVGHVLEVAALASEDIFHGIVFAHTAHGHPCLAPASDIARITDRAVYLSVDSAAAAAYGEFQQLHVSRLGLRGISRWKHLGWKESSE